MDQMTIMKTPDADNCASKPTPAVRVLSLLRERLECIGADMVTLMRAIDKNDIDAITELETEIRRNDGFPGLDRHHSL